MGGRGGSGGARGAGKGGGGGGVEAKIRSAYDKLANRLGQWVPLADLREALPGVGRESLDAALKRLAVAPGVEVTPWDNTKVLTARDHAAALHFGGDKSHAISIQRGGRR